ncbi:Transcriptional regulator, LysR family [Labilithrix luteola]|uniref:Transcriptional regulator, LysR family n=1 Tax=Labilithrix luteola TaxID=1391654 RepID=A0A0K1PPG9_9BACT|nr:LysR family transcriptional regulator [Labilithrix luteola]AKU95014.1 Transcriptional regulator, LysR family [Labilithrix luteola]
MDLNEIQVFARVVQTGSFIAASALLGMPKSTVSRKVSDLEKRLNARLLQRTTRKLSLTDVGRTYYDYCARIIAEVEDAERAVSSLQDSPRGPLRVTAGPNVTFLAPIISDYLKCHPEVRIELVTTTRSVDLVEERFDLGIRAGNLADSSLVARSLGRVGWFLVATPAYLKKHGRPRSPEELANHDFLFFGAGLEGVGPRLEKDGRTVHVALSPRLSASDMDMLHAVTTAGLGIALLPAFQCVEQLRSGRLTRVLADWNAPSVPVHAVYPSARHISPKVKTFLEHLQARMTPPPWELGPAP